jgi:type VI secretion system secreted protein VgrG
VVRQVSRGRSNREETLYHFDIGPRLSRLADGCTTRLFQNSSIPQVIESVLRQQELSGADFSFQLTGKQATHAHLTQWRESDLQFITRLAAYAGLFYQFSQADDGRDVLAFGDNLEHYARGHLQDVPLRPLAGLESHAAEAVSSFVISHRSMLRQVRRSDFNYLTASTTLDRSSGFAGEVAAARGLDYAWGEGGRDAAETEAIARCAIRHRRHASVRRVAVAMCCIPVRARCCGWPSPLPKHRMAG